MKELLTALLAAKNDLKPVFRDSKNNHRNYKYVSLDCILESITPVLSKHGLLIVQYVQDTNLVTELYHCETAQVIKSNFPLEKNPDPQKVGSQITYYRRYQLSAMLGLVGTDNDTDCHEYVETISPWEQVTSYAKSLDIEKKTLLSVLKQLNLTWDKVDNINKYLILNSLKDTAKA